MSLCHYVPPVLLCIGHLDQAVSAMPRDVHTSSLGTATTLPTHTDCLAGLLELGNEKTTWINYEGKAVF